MARAARRSRGLKHGLGVNGSGRGHRLKLVAILFDEMGCLP